MSEPESEYLRSLDLLEAIISVEPIFVDEPSVEPR